MYLAMSDSRTDGPRLRVFGLSDWLTWMDRMAGALFGMTGAEFEAAFVAGHFVNSGPGQDLGAMLPLIARLREREDPNITSYGK